MSFAQLARFPAVGFYDAIGIVLVILGITAVGAYSVGRQNSPATSPPAASPSVVAKPVPLVGPTAPASASVPAPSSNPPPPAKTTLPDKPVPPDNKRKVEAALTAAAIAAIIVQASRNQYYATGRPCACPDDSMRNGKACGGRSAYSRPGGASPLCYPSDVTAAMIESYRQRQASR